MNTWIQFLKEFYKNEKMKDGSRCRNRVKISSVAKVYNCKKRMANRKTKKSDKFTQKNPLFSKNKTRSMHMK